MRSGVLKEKLSHCSGSGRSFQAYVFNRKGFVLPPVRSCAAAAEEASLQPATPLEAGECPRILPCDSSSKILDCAVLRWAGTPCMHPVADIRIWMRSLLTVLRAPCDAGIAPRYPLATSTPPPIWSACNVSQRSQKKAPMSRRFPNYTSRTQRVPGHL